MSTQTPSTDMTAAQTHLEEKITSPRTRWAAIIWGALFALVAATSLWLIVDDQRRAGIADWLLALTPTTISTLVILTIGVLLLITGAAGLLRRMQRRMTAGPAPAPAGGVLTK